MKKIFTKTMGSETTPAYTAPEIICGLPTTTKVDMWALGIILYQMVS